jgi:hypothetical protein
VDKYKLLDLEDILKKVYESVWGPSGSGGKAAGATTKRGRGPASLRRNAAEPDVDEVDDANEEDLDALAASADDEDDVDAQARLTELADEAGLDANDYKTWADVVEVLGTLASQEETDAADGVGEDEAEDGEDGDEAEDADPDAEEEDYWDEESLQAEPIGSLRAIAREAGISTTGLNKAALIEAILEGDEEE